MQGYINQRGVKGRKKEAKKQNKKDEMERNFDQDIKLFWHFSGD